jgi:NAD(P)H-hydrate epimerase
MIRVVSVEAMRAIEAEADSTGVMSYADMMEAAGRAASLRALHLISSLEDPRVTVLVGAGNNGGDGLVAARVLRENHAVQVRAYLLTRREDNLRRAAEAAGVFIAYAEDDHDHRVLRNMVASADLVIDALFGIGVRLPLRDEAARVLRGANQALNERRAARPSPDLINPIEPQPLTQPLVQVLAIDCPSGLDCDSGELDKNAIPADETLTFIAAKPGHFQFPGAQAVSRLIIAPLFSANDAPTLAKERTFLVDAAYAQNRLPARGTDSHKGTHGTALIIGGSINYSGAPALAARAAYRAGAGLVTIGAPGPVVTALAAQIMEPTWVLLPHDLGIITEKASAVIGEQLGKTTALLIGPGLGQGDASGNLIRALLQIRATGGKNSRRAIGFGNSQQTSAASDEDFAPNALPPLVIDADGLNLLAKIDAWPQLLPASTILTPHPGEMSRLAGIDTQTVQSSRWTLAVEKAAEWNVILLLKGAHTLIAAPDGRLAVLPFKTDALAKAGTGDVLAGIITGLLAQGMEPFEAAVCGGYLHGLAGTLAAEQVGSGRSVVAGDVIEMLPAAFGRVEAR